MSPKTETKSRALVFFGEHPREIVSPEIGFNVLLHFCGSYLDSAADLPLSEEMKKNILDCPKCKELDGVLNQMGGVEGKGVEVKLVLNANPRGREKVENGQFSERWDADGVDINRDWQRLTEAIEAEFAPKDSSLKNLTAYSETNQGKQNKQHPFTAPETQILHQVVVDYQPHVFLSVHSGYRGIFMPWASLNALETLRHGDEMMEIMSEVAMDKTLNLDCPFGRMTEVLRYSSPSNCLDYVFLCGRAQYAYAFERIKCLRGFVFVLVVLLHLVQVYVRDDKEEANIRRLVSSMNATGTMLQSSSAIALSGSVEAEVSPHDHADAETEAHPTAPQGLLEKRQQPKRKGSPGGASRTGAGLHGETGEGSGGPGSGAFVQTGTGSASSSRFADTSPDMATKGGCLRYFNPIPVDGTPSSTVDGQRLDRAVIDKWTGATLQILLKSAQRVEDEQLKEGPPLPRMLLRPCVRSLPRCRGLDRRGESDSEEPSFF
uniref:Peptidase M14 domain-containing protein n=1 Tax=Chromera velia CCMP2878 TaxID=1169474 RepID=A0A0G4F6T1_9ALVE|eukprot:Cvel_15371.t1-p1 / transcript=Cvel_15371.t1 / gene=Cvel_15371 / organism=Chromera_velia_CCMP2878 / gene_product=hypothetical protein / transcript_product=hypothetical protein / location=Cvel_scaffold1133:23008-29427(-) / protein_length=489 / sequence_SO=supercontig / SO=protein_coding / is_pseudo=false